jgi:uncharacterized membrane protein YphA (DoxX/SURF4 family)
VHAVLSPWCVKEQKLQRWYRTFPRGLPGIGLLVLRLAIGAKPVVEASSCLLHPQGLKLEVSLLSLLVLGAGTFIVLGFLTQLVAGVSVLAGAGVYLWHPAWASCFLNLSGLDMIVVALAIALLGPGAISLDAYFFGRRKIVIPPVARS